MILAIDMGNTNIVIGGVDEGEICFEERVSTDITKTDLEYAIILKNILDIHEIKASEVKGSIISSVVPPLTKVIGRAVEKIFGIEPMIVGPGIKMGMNLLMDDPKSIGADLIVGAVAATKQYGSPVIIIDMGTATTFVVVDKDANFIGGIILPGIRTSLLSLVNGTSALPAISLEAPGKVLGKNTITAMQSGVIYGNASMIDGMIERIEAELGYTCNVVATGGLAKSVVAECKHKVDIDEELLLKGLYIIYKKNKKEDTK